MRTLMIGLTLLFLGACKHTSIDVTFNECRELGGEWVKSTPYGSAGGGNFEECKLGDGWRDKYAPSVGL